ncbi:MAG: hypothetical protein LAP87_15640 [Acidobacteriia bacterium]|nr:hypothetical protein [Terriglobia bacterium]
MDVSVGVVTILFTLSLVAAWILFKFLQSTATITKKEYQMGGAAAGFLIIYGALYSSYTHLATVARDQSKNDLAVCVTNLQKSKDENSDVSIKGAVDPPPRNAWVVFATKTVSLPNDGTFRFSARRKDVKSDDPPDIYVITEQEQSHQQLDPGDDLSNVKITLPKKGGQ